MTTRLHLVIFTGLFQQKRFVDSMTRKSPNPMCCRLRKNVASLVFLIFSVFLLASVWAEDKAAYEVESNWPGVVMKVAEIKRIPEDRMVIVVRLVATQDAPRDTLIGYQEKIPESATPEQVAFGLYTPSAFSLKASTVTDEQTGKTFEVAKPKDDDIALAPTSIMSRLNRGRSLLLAVYFQIPPPLPLGADGKPPKHTFSLQLPNAKGLITKIPVPPAT